MIRADDAIARHRGRRARALRRRAVELGEQILRERRADRRLTLLELAESCLRAADELAPVPARQLEPPNGTDR